jgi:hypothetical protein
MQELEPYGAALSHISGWSRSRKAMRLRQLLLRIDVQHNKHVSKRGGGTVVEPEPYHFGGAIAATRCSSGSRIKIFYPEPHQNVAAPQLFTAPAAVKGCGSGRTERMRLWLH